MQSQRFFLGAVGVLVACLYSVPAHANLSGIVQKSGKTAGQTCMSAGCHNDSPSNLVPTVEISGPTTLEAGATGTYTLIIRGGPAVKAGMNVAVSNNGGTLNKTGSDLKVVAGELTHTAPKDFANNEARFDFTLVAPSAAGTSKLFASGNSTNGNGAKEGDHAVSTTLDIQVTAAQQPPDAGMPPGGGGGNEEDDGGCSAAGGAPLLALLALIAAAGLGRRAA